MNIEAKELSKIYGSGESRVVALDKVCLLYTSPAVFPCIGAPDASLLLPVISLLDGHSLVKVLCGMKLPTAIIIADYS